MLTIDPVIAAKLSASLRAEIEFEREKQHAIAVTFTHAMSRAQVSALGLNGEGTVVYGNLNTMGVLRVAASPDVLHMSDLPTPVAS
jgi:hypothetical protein